jgi:hypothetical protein
MRRAIALVIFSAWLLHGCATLMRPKGMVLEDMGFSLGTIQEVVIKNLPGGTKKISANAREFFSGYFASSGRFDLDATTDQVRMQIHVLILGDRRPYTIEVIAIRQTRSSGSTYTETGSDSRIAAAIANKIRQDLVDRRDKRNVIDNFRAF